MRSKFILFIIPFIMLLIACNVAQDKNKQTITSGVLKIGVDESFSLMMDSQIFTYTRLNKYAEILPSYKPEADVMRDLLNDSIQSAVVGRALNEEELVYFKSIRRLPESILIARDGIALILNPANTDTTINMRQLRAIFEGRDSLWSQLSAKSVSGKIQVVFDNPRSCNVRTIKEKFGIDEFPPYCFSQRTNEEVINYVNQNKNAIGIISISWISDPEDPLSAKYRSMVNTYGIVDSTNIIKPGLARRPFQAYVFDESYPLRRDVYYIRTGLSGTLGTGFANHLAGEKGQLIIHKMGMVAAKTPNRTVKII